MFQGQKQKRGGIVVGPPHNKDGTPGGGVPLPLIGTGRTIEEEGFEINIPHEIRDLKGTHTFTGKKIDVLNQILQLGGYSITDKVEAVEPRDVVICVRSAWDDTPISFTGTIEETLNHINTSQGCKPIPAVSAALAKNGGSIPKGVKIREKDWQALDPNSPRWKKKKESIQQLSNNIHRLRLNISRDMQSDDEREALTALVVALMDRTAERIGNDDSADNGHFGVTGFRKKHITVVGNKVHLEYVGKSGTKHDKSVSDLRIAKAMKKAIKNAPGKFIFETSDGFRVKCDKVNRYLEPFNISAKDIRGYNANKWIIEQLKSQRLKEFSDNPAKAEKERKKIFNKAVKETAARVGHGTGTLKKHYMIPELPIQYIQHGAIIDMKSIGYFKDGGPLGDLRSEKYFANKNEVPDVVNKAIEKIYLAAQDEGVDKFFADQEIKIVDWKDVVPTQDFLRSSKFNRLESVTDLDAIGIPWAVEYQGKYYVNDGHHRTVKRHERKMPIKLHVYQIESFMKNGSVIPYAAPLIEDAALELLDDGGTIDEKQIKKLKPGDTIYYKRPSSDDALKLTVIEVREWGDGTIDAVNVKNIDNHSFDLKGRDLEYLFKSLPKEDGYSLEKKFSRFVNELVGEHPGQSSGLIKLINSNSKSGEFTLTFVEEVKDGRSRRFNEQSPLQLKGKEFSTPEIDIKITDIKHLETEKQESDSDHDYYSIKYNVKVDLRKKDDESSIEEKIEQRLKERQKTKEFKDTGVATYTRKYQAAYDVISYSDLADIEKDNVTAYKLIEKAKIWPLYNVNELKSQGNTSGAAFMKVKCREFLSARPLDTKEAREVYVKNIEKLRSGLESIKTAFDVQSYLSTFVDLDTFDLGDLSGFKTSYYISSRYKGNLAKYNEKQVEEYFNDIFGKKFYNFCKNKSDSAKAIHIESFLYESYTQATKDAYVNKRYAVLQESLKRYQGLKDSIEASSGTEAEIKKLIDESGIPYYEYNYKKDHVIEFLDKYIAYLSSQTLERIISTLSKAHTVREQDWSWAEGTKEKKAAAPKDEEGKPRKPQNIFEKYGIDIPKVIKRTPLEYVKRTGGLEVGDISTKAVLENYGFKNIIYGNYVNDAESKEHTKHILGGMLDMVEICNIDIKDINKLGGLDINIGATGCGPFSGASACYFPSLKAINLTKKRGDGSLGHEWAHYLDNTLAQGPEKSATHIPYASLNPVKSERITSLFTEYHNWLLNGGTFRKIKVMYYPQNKFMFRIYADTLPEAIEAVQSRYAAYKNYKNFESKDLIRYYGYLAYKLNNNQPLEIELETRATQFYIGTSSYTPSDYFLNPKEMFARAFEGWLEYKLEKMGRTSNYLVDIKSGMGSLSMVIPQSEWCYPSGSDVIWLNDWFERLFSAIRVDYGIKPFTWGTQERVDEYTDYKDNKNSKVEAGVEVKSDGTVLVEGDIEEFEKGYGFRTETIRDTKGKNRNIQRLLTNPYNRGKGFATGGLQSDVFIFALKYFTGNKSGYGIADGLTQDLPNIVRSLPDATMEEVKTEAVKYFKSNKESKPKKPMMKESDYQPELFEEGGPVGMPPDPPSWEDLKKFFEGELPSKIPAEKFKTSIGVAQINLGKAPYDSFNIRPIPYKLKSIEEPLVNIVGTDDLRPPLQTIHYDAPRKEKVATNAHILVMVKDKSITKTKNIFPSTGQELDGTYPDYTRVLPTDNAYKIHLTSSQVDALMDKLNGIVRAKRFLVKNEDYLIVGKISYKDIEMYLNPVFLLTVLIALKQYGATDMDFEFSSPNRALMIIDSRKNGNQALVMPIVFKDDMFAINLLDTATLASQPAQKKVEAPAAAAPAPAAAKSAASSTPKKDRKSRPSIHTCAVQLGRRGGLASAKARKKMHWGGDIEDTDPHDGSDVSPDSTEYLIDMELKPLIDKVRRKAILPEYQSKFSDADILGLIVSKYNRWDGDKIKVTSASAFEDANYHDIAKQVSQFEDGGSIINQYEGKNPKQVWDAWTPYQRNLFYHDHFTQEELNELPDISVRIMEYGQLPVWARKKLDHHVKLGQYNDGGSAGEQKKSESKACGCFHSFLKKENPELVAQLEAGNVNSNPALRAQVDAAHRAWQGGQMNEGGELSYNAQSTLKTIKHLSPNPFTVDTTQPSKDTNKAIEELESKGFITRISYNRGFADYALK